MSDTCNFIGQWGDRLNLLVAVGGRNIFTADAHRPWGQLPRVATKPKADTLQNLRLIRIQACFTILLSKKGRDQRSGRNDKFATMQHHLKNAMVL